LPTPAHVGSETKGVPEKNDVDRSKMEEEDGGPKRTAVFLFEPLPTISCIRPFSSFRAGFFVEANWVHVVMRRTFLLPAQVTQRPLRGKGHRALAHTGLRLMTGQGCMAGAAGWNAVNF